MKRTYLFILGGLLLLIYGFLANYFDFGARTLGSLNNFGSVFRQVFVIASMLILLAALSGSTADSMRVEMHPERFVQYWWAGFAPMLVVALGFAIIVNPHARFSGDFYPPVNVGARKIKMDLYRDLESSPDLVIMGSSRAFTMSPSYIEEKTGYSAFNMAVESGDAGDFYIQSKYVLKTGPAPHVFLVEIHQNSFGDVSKTWLLQPVAMIPFIPWDGALALSEDSLKDALGLQSISDSIYSSFISKKKETWTINLDQYGTGIRTPPTHEEYKKLLNAALKGPTKNNAYCKRLTPDGKAILEAMIKNAQENGIGVVLYESPMNYSFYNAAYEENPEGFNNCRNLVNSYLSSLAKSFPNVFIRDLTVYEPISKLREDGYYDAVHPRPEAAEMVLDTLVPEIENAMKWSLEATSK